VARLLPAAESQESLQFRKNARPGVEGRYPAARERYTEQPQARATAERDKEPAAEPGAAHRFSFPEHPAQ
jgi:hypothetical protein